MKGMYLNENAIIIITIIIIRRIRQNSCNNLFPLDMFCLGNMCVDTLHKGDNDDDDDNNNNHHNHKHQGLDPLIRSVSRVTVALSSVSSVFLLSFFLVACSGMISRDSVLWHSLQV